jgi:hypothetical protein
MQWPEHSARSLFWLQKSGSRLVSFQSLVKLLNYGFLSHSALGRQGTEDTVKHTWRPQREQTQ